MLGAVAVLGHAGHGLTEVRAIDPAAQLPPWIGVFDNHESMADAVVKFDGGPRNFYIGVNPRRPLPGRPLNRFVLSGKGGAADDIETVTAICLDLDPVRAEGHKGEAATDEEFKRALRRANEIVEWFASNGWKRPLRVASGNGVQLWCPVPATKVTNGDRAAVARALKAFWALVLEAFPNTPEVVLDNISDLPRIVKLVGSVARKGAGGGDRPHRVSHFIDRFDDRGTHRGEDAELMAYVLGLPLQDDEPRPRAPWRPAADHGLHGADTPYGRAALEEEINTILGAPVGARNNTLNASAFAVAQLVAGGEIGEHAHAEIESAALSTGLGEHEVETTMRSAFEAGRKEPRSAPPRPVTQGAPAPTGRTEATVPAQLGDALDDAARKLLARAQREESPIAFPPELHAVSAKLCGGLWPGAMYLLSGGTGAGKTAFALQVAWHAAKQGAPCLYVNLELDTPQAVARLLSLEALASGENVFWSDLYYGTGQDAPARLKRLMSAHGDTLRRAPFGVASSVGAFGWSYEGIEREVAALASARTTLPPVFVLDYLQIISSPEGRREELRERIGRAAYHAREAARKFGAVVLLVSSVAREHYAHLSIEDDSPPAPDSLVGVGKESGEIEFAADVVLALVKQRWDKDSPPPDGTKAWCVVAKQRGGTTGAVELRFDWGRYRQPEEPPKWQTGR
jgi:replicative DNA helicase